MIERWLLKHVPHEVIGWKEYNETFIRWFVFQCRWFEVYLHKLHAPEWLPECHDHPWNFVSFVLRRGYTELLNRADGAVLLNHEPGAIIYRKATDAHVVYTPNGPAWSLVVVGPNVRKWGFKACGAK